MLRKLLFFVALILATSALLQAQTGSLAGKITDKATKEAIPFVNLIVEMGGKQMGGATTDFDGNFIIKPLNPGRYDLKASYVGYKPIMITQIVVSPDKITRQDIPMESSATTLNVVEVIEYKVPLIEADQTSSGQTLTSDEITKMPGRDASSVAILTGGVFSQDGSMGSVRGQRDDATNIYIDGIRVRGSANVPQSAIDQVSMTVGGIPAQYGDATGGILSITTKGPSAKFTGGAELVSSQLTDKFGYNLASLSLQGPLLRDSSKSIAKAGFFISGEFGTEADDRPSRIGYYRVKADKLKELEEKPLRIIQDRGVAEASFLRMSDLEKVDRKINSRRYNGSVAAKLDFKPTSSTNLVFGASASFNFGREFDYGNSLMNFDNNAHEQSYNGRAFVRFQQRFATEPDNSSLFKNIFYNIQFDVSKTHYKIEDVNKKDNFMNYGYLGEYNVKSAPNYEAFGGFGPDSVYYSKYFVFQGIRDTNVTFKRSEENPVYANYASQFFNLWPEHHYNYSSLQDVRLAGGIRNGDFPLSGSTHEGLWSLPGMPYNFYAVQNTTTVGVNGMISGDVGKHSLQIGFQLEQRTDRAFQVNRPVGLWEQLRLNVNKHILQLDQNNYILSMNKDVDGDGENDTVFDYNFSYNAATQGLIDLNLRRKMGKPIGGTEQINIDALEPSMISLDMFAADELLNYGRAFVTYFGYSYYGKKSETKSTFDDFFTKKDADGFNTRPIDAFRPVYMAAYIQDKFYFDDLIFNVGVRMDRYDANQMVLKDPYLFYEAKNVGELTHFSNGDKINHPSNIKDDFTPYVDNPSTPNAIVAYRSENKFYTASGSEITDNVKLQQLDLQGLFKPVLKNPELEHITSASFKDYKPQYVFMPRVAFSFPISDVANFSAIYNVLTKRPSTGWRLNPVDYYFFETGGTNIINNPDLKPEKSISYELGFQQKIGKTSALKLNTYYTEMRDQIQRFQYLGAYPKSYIGYRNIDFGTSKGFTLAYDLRRTGNIRLLTSYTLGFVEGTGSSATSALTLIRSGQGNLRSTTALNYDRRHSITANIDFRYEDGKDYNGPVIKKSNGDLIQLFANTGINTTFMAGSGVPYTKSSKIYSITGWGTRQISGRINGARQPWEFSINTKIDRDFALGAKKNQYLNVYVEVFNLLNRKNVIAVYEATGVADDDGVLASAEMQPFINNQIDVASFREMYTIAINDPNRYSMPRRIRVGLIFNF